jgi:hypothetical protein
MLFQLKITLKGLKPPIWRRVLVSEDSTLLDLHDLIQYCFDWVDYHLHLFQIAGMEFVQVEHWEEDGDLYQDDRLARLGDLIPRYVPEGKSFNYEYDFGDGWELQIKVEKLVEDEGDTRTPRILAGRRAAPPEDVGGTWGYENFLEAIQDPRHPEHDDYLTWVGGDFDSEDFDPAEYDKDLSKTLRRRTLIRESTWPVGPLYGNFRAMTQNKWTESLPQRLKVAAADLPLRHDMVTLLTYLQNHKVKGTKARGNFPRKDIRAVTADFVNPPTLDVEFGDIVWKLQTEDDITDLLRYHYLACMAGLIFGGENLPWEVLPQGEVFLSLPPESQVWYLAHVWFTEFNWIYEYEAPEHDALSAFKASVVARFSSYPIEVDIPKDQVFRDLIAFELRNVAQDDLDDFLRVIDRVVFQPLGTFGIIKANESHPMDKFISTITGIRIPKLGHHILAEQKDYFKDRGWIPQ